MFSRDWLELVTILKSAMKLNVDPAMQVSSFRPVRGSRMFVTSAILTSLAVQLSFCFWTLLYSSCKQVCADEVAAKTPIANSATANRPSLFGVIHRDEFGNSVPMMVFLLVVCAHVY